MASTKDKVMREIEKMADDAGFDADCDYSFSNRVTVYFRKEFETHATVQLAFDGHTLTAFVGMPGGERQQIYVNYPQVEEFKKLFSTIASVLARGSK